MEELLKSIEIGHLDIDLEEIQGDPVDIAKSKVLLASKHVSNPVIIEDISLCFHALENLPGPYVKPFVDKLGNLRLYKLLDGFEDKSATA